MAKENKKAEPPPVDNVISEETGQFDLTVYPLASLLFAAPYFRDTLPSQLDGELRICGKN